MIDRLRYALHAFNNFKRHSNAIREYAAAQQKARYTDHKASRGSADYELRQGLATVRAKCRDLARNSATMKRYTNLMVTNIIGDSGFMFQCRVRRNDKTLDRALNERVEAAWAAWCKSVSVCGRMDMIDLTETAVQTWCRDGEVIIEIVRNFAYRDGVALNIIEADHLDETLNTVYPNNGNEIRMGVEINKSGVPVAYHFLTQHPGDNTWYSYRENRHHRRVSAEQVIHIFKRLRPGQTRGEPPAASIVNPIKMLDGYREAEVVNRRIAASTMGFFTRDIDKPAGISELADGEDEADSRFEMDVEPGVLREIPPGMRFDKFDPGGSQTDYADFEAQVKKDISMGLNISAFSLGMETSGVSYSTGRSVLVEDRDYYRSMHSFFIRHLMEPVFSIWVSSHMLSDDSSIPPTRADAVRLQHKFRGRGWDWVDPAKEVKANAEALATSQTSLARVAAMRGIDRDDLLDEIEEDRIAAENRGLTLSYITDKSSQTVEDDEDDDDS